MVRRWRESERDEPSYVPIRSRQFLMYWKEHQHNGDDKGDPSDHPCIPRKCPDAVSFSKKPPIDTSF